MLQNGARSFGDPSLNGLVAFFLAFQWCGSSENPPFNSVAAPFHAPENDLAFLHQFPLVSPPSFFSSAPLQSVPSFFEHNPTLRLLTCYIFFFSLAKIDYGKFSFRKKNDAMRMGLIPHSPKNHSLTSHKRFVDSTSLEMTPHHG